MNKISIISLTIYETVLIVNIFINRNVFVQIDNFVIIITLKITDKKMQKCRILYDKLISFYYFK